MSNLVYILGVVFIIYLTFVPKGEDK